MWNAKVAFAFYNMTERTLLRVYHLYSYLSLNDNSNVINLIATLVRPIRITMLTADSL